MCPGIRLRLATPLARIPLIRTHGRLIATIAYSTACFAINVDSVLACDLVCLDCNGIILVPIQAKQQLHGLNMKLSMLLDIILAKLFQIPPLRYPYGVCMASCLPGWV